MTSGSTFVVRGVVVQYIPPAGSVVGSLSIRVESANAHGRPLLGELVTVPVARALRANQLVPQQSRCTVTLNARSSGSILKGAAVVKAIVPSAPVSAHAGGTAPKVDPETTSGNDAGGAAQPSDHGDGVTGDHASGHAAANGGSAAANAAGQAHAAAASSNAHKATP